MMHVQIMHSKGMYMYVPLLIESALFLLIHVSELYMSVCVAH